MRKKRKIGNNGNITYYVSLGYENKIWKQQKKLDQEDQEYQCETS